MVFMGAATIDGNAPLIEAAEADLEEMAAVGSGDALNIFAQVHRGRDVVPRRAWIKEGMSTRIDASRRSRKICASWMRPGPHASSSRHSTVRDTTPTILTTTPYSCCGPCLCLRLRARADQRRDHRCTRSLPRCRVSWRGCKSNSRRQVRAPYPRIRCLRYLDGRDCMPARSVREYLLGSEIGIPLPGWPYDRILDRLRYPDSPKGIVMGPAEFGVYTVRRICESYKAESRAVSLTLLNLDCALDVFTQAEMLALVLARAIGDADARDRIANLFVLSKPCRANHSSTWLTFV